MKTPRQYLLDRHRAAETKLDALRQEVVAGLAEPATAKPQRIASAPTEALPWWCEVFRLPAGSWAALATAWLVIVAFKLSSQEGAVATHRARALPPQAITQMEQRRILFAELTESPLKLEAPAPHRPRPRTARRPFGIAA